MCLYRHIFSVLLLVLSVVASAQQPPAIEEIYTLNVGDEISIQVIGEPDLSLTIKVNEAGAFDYPYLGELEILGKTTTQVQEMITLGLDGDFLVNPRVSVNMINYREIFVSGEVNTPGEFPFQPGLTVAKAIALAGGNNNRADLSQVLVVAKIDGAEVEKQVNQDYELSPGDVVKVSAFLEIYINGEVNQSGSYPFRPGLTMNKAVALAGGFTERAAKSRVLVLSEGDTKGKRVKLNTVVKPGDVITVQRRFF